MQNLAREDRKLDKGDSQTEKDTDILNGKKSERTINETQTPTETRKKRGKHEKRSHLLYNDQSMNKMEHWEKKMK